MAYINGQKIAFSSYLVDGNGYYNKEETAAMLDTKADKVAEATENNLASLDAEGNVKDSGKNPNDFMSNKITLVTGTPTSNVNTATLCTGVKCGKVVCVQGSISLKNQLDAWAGLWSVEGLPKSVAKMWGGTSIDSFTGNLPYISINQDGSGITLQNRETVLPANAWVNFWITYITND